jgi:hypothetical protein
MTLGGGRGGSPLQNALPFRVLCGPSLIISCYHISFYVYTTVLLGRPAFEILYPYHLQRLQHLRPQLYPSLAQIYQWLIRKCAVNPSCLFLRSETQDLPVT